MAHLMLRGNQKSSGMLIECMVEYKDWVLFCIML